ncbi:MAG: histidine kinase dimerization/phospho-acceptor domain-containing protein, partial [Patescibacteria group bacterium]
MPNGGHDIVSELLTKGNVLSDKDYRAVVRLAVVNLRTPLTGLTGYLTMLAEGDFGKLTQEQKEIVEKLEQAAKDIIVEVNQFVELEKINPKINDRVHNKKLLHFEDDQLLAEMYGLKFANAGVEYKNYPNPTMDPVSVVLTEKPDIILMGIIMPIMSGDKATLLLKENPNTKNIPIIGLDNLGQAEDLKSFREAGMSD